MRFRLLLPLLLPLLAPPLAAQEDVPAIKDDVVADGEAAPEAPAEKEPLNAQISRHILKLAEAERDTRMGFMRIVIDDIVGLCDLDATQRERLELAAKGAAERSMKEWHEQAERYFRQRLESASDPDAAKEMLEGMGGVNFSGNRSEEQGESLDLWKDSLKDVLTKEQVERYETILAQREDDRVDAFARMSLSTIDDHLRLTPEQKSKMAEIVRAAAAAHLTEMQKFWGDYFERGMLMSLANAAEEETLRSVLTEKQFERFREATSNFDHFWNEKRRQRTRDKEEGKASKKQEEAKEDVRKAIRVGGGGIRVKID